MNQPQAHQGHCNTMDEIQQPVITPNPVSERVEEKEVTAPYVVEGVVIGVVIALFIIAGIYYKSTQAKKLTNSSQTAVQTAEEKAQQKELQMAIDKAKATPFPTVTPVTVTSQKDLTTQQSALDSTDLNDLSKGLEMNASDSSEFAL